MSLLAEVLVFLIAAILTVPVCKRLGLSSVLGYLAAGLVIGPSGLGLIGEADEVLHFAEIGVVLLLFIIGLELQPRRLWIMRRAVFGLGTAQVLATSVPVALILVAVFGLDWGAAALIGFALALSSTAFVLQLLGERRKLHTAHGRAAFGVLLLQDIAVIPAIAVLNLLMPPGAGGGAMNPWWLAAIGAGLLAARATLRPALRFVASTGITELFAAAGLALVVGFALAMQAAGLSMGLGAFIAGMMVADSEYRHQLQTDVNPFKGLLLGLFFIAVGMSANLGLLAEIPLLVLGLVVALVAIKAAVVWPLARWHGLAAPEALRAAAVLAQGGEFAFVLLTTGISAALISARMADIAVLVVTLSMAVTPLLVGLAERLLAAPGPVRPFDDIDAPEEPDGTVIIAGFGRFGQIVARLLTVRRIAFTALEISPSQVDFVRRFGNEIYYGDAARLDLLRSAHVADARAFVLAVDDEETSLRIAQLVREAYPQLKVFARARNRHHEIRLRRLGVHFVIRETLLSSLALAESLLGHVGLSAEQAAATVALFREHDARTLVRQSAVFDDETAFRQTSRDAAAELKALFSEDAAADVGPQQRPHRKEPPTAA